MEESSAEFPRPDERTGETAKDAVAEALDMARKMGREVRILVLDMEGNEWTYGFTVSEALTLIKFKKEGVLSPAITLRERITEAGEIITEFVVTAKNGVLKEVFYGNDGNIKSIEDKASAKQENGVYEFKVLPQNINILKTEKMFRENLRLFKGELPILVPAKSKAMREPQQRKVVQPQPILRRAKAA